MQNRGRERKLVSLKEISSTEIIYEGMTEAISA